LVHKCDGPIVCDGPNDVSAVQVGAVAQVYTHLTHAALKQHGWVGTPSLSDGSRVHYRSPRMETTSVHA